MAYEIINPYEKLGSFKHSLQKTAFKFPKAPIDQIAQIPNPQILTGLIFDKIQTQRMHQKTTKNTCKISPQKIWKFKFDPSPKWVPFNQWLFLVPLKGGR